MKLLPHDYYFNIVNKMMKNIEKKEYKEIFIKKAIEENNAPLLSFIERADNKKLDPFYKLTDAHYLMAKMFQINPTVFIVERELSLALLNSKSSVKIEDINLISNNFVLYLNLNYEDFGFPKIDEVYRPCCVHCQILEKKDVFIINICSITQNIAGKDPKISPLDNLENSTFSSVIIKKGIKFDQSFFDEEKAATVEKYKKTGEQEYLNVMEDGNADYDIKAKIYHLIVAMHLYLNNDSDLQIEKPEITAKDIEKISNPKKKKKAMKKLSQEISYNVSYVGRKYAEKIRKTHVHSNTDRQPKYSFKVKGFFNTYWYGKRRDEFGNKIPGEYTKIKWIEPQIRNKEFQEKPSHGKIYKVR